MKCEYGVCLNCEKEIVTKCGACNSPQAKTNDYTEVELNWSNGSRMKTAVCRECALGPIWKADKAELTKAIWSKWDAGFNTYDKGITIV